MLKWMEMETQRGSTGGTNVILRQVTHSHHRRSKGGCYHA